MSTYLKDLVERAAKTAAQTAVASFVGGGVGLLDVDWIQVISLSGMAAIVSVLTSIASQGFGNNGTASLVPAVVDGAPDRRVP